MTQTREEKIAKAVEFLNKEIDANNIDRALATPESIRKLAEIAVDVFSPEPA